MMVGGSVVVIVIMSMFVFFGSDVRHCGFDGGSFGIDHPTPEVAILQDKIAGENSSRQEQPGSLWLLLLLPKTPENQSSGQPQNDQPGGFMGVHHVMDHFIVRKG